MCQSYNKTRRNLSQIFSYCFFFTVFMSLYFSDSVSCCHLLSDNTTRWIIRAWFTDVGLTRVLQPNCRSRFRYWFRTNFNVLQCA